MGEGLPAAGLFKAHLQSGGGQALGINCQQQHRTGRQVAIEEGCGGLHLVGVAQVDEAHLLQGAPPGGAAIHAIGPGRLPLRPQRQVIEPAGRAPGSPCRPGLLECSRQLWPGQKPTQPGLERLDLGLCIEARRIH